MKVMVDSCYRVPGSDLVFLDKLDRYTSFLNPEYIKRERLGLSVWKVPQKLCMLRRQMESDYYILPGGESSRIAIEKCARGAVFYEDKRIEYPRTPIQLGLELRPYQKRAVRVLSEAGRGIAQAPCGAGKTVMAMGLIATLGQPSLILVHTKDLAQQWRDAIEGHLGATAGMIGDGTCTITPFTVALVQSASRSYGWEKMFGCVVVDEAHHIPADTFLAVLERLPARYRFGFTATPERDDGLTPILGYAIGPVIDETTHRELVDGGYLMVPEVRKMPTGCASSAADYGGQIAELVADPGRNRLITDLACGSVMDGRSTLVLTTRVAHAEILAEALDCGCLHGKSKKSDRKKILDRFRDGSDKCLVATTLADEGLDISRLEALILALPQRSFGRTVQRLGRLMRPMDGKRTPVLMDLVDSHKSAKNQWYARRRAYKSVLGAGGVNDKK